MTTAALVLALITAGLSSAYYDDCYDCSYDSYYDSYDDCYDDCYDGEFMTDPESCCHYYVCDHGRPVRFVCGEGTYYSPDLRTCDHQRNVDCGTRSTEGCGGYNDRGSNNECDNSYQCYKNDKYDNNDRYGNNGCDNNDRYGNNGRDNNDQYNNCQYDNNCDDNNKYCSDENNYSEYDEDVHWIHTEEGTMYNPLQMGYGPNSDVPIENLKAYDATRGSKTVDDSYAVDNYYDGKAS